MATEYYMTEGSSKKKLESVQQERGLGIRVRVRVNVKARAGF